jgi:hypothetical protein
MTGPNYGPEPGSNAIGLFVIGVSPIGSIPSFDVWTTVLQQYANSPILTQLIQNFAEYVDPTANTDQFFDLMWNIDTAQGYGLDVWGRIVGVKRVLRVSSLGLYFGFAEATVLSAAPFNQASFYNGEPLSDNFALSDTAFRQLIFAKALSNISDGSIPAINQILLNLFPHRGNCYVIDNEDMTMVYRFEFQLTDVEAAIIVQSGVLPKPVGVLATVSQT